ncbi:MAG: ATP-binding protein [Verrucomicrobiota bacterium]
MQPLYDYKRYAVLYVDDEEKSLKAFSRAFGDEFRIFTASNAKDGAQIITEKKDEIAVLMTDQKMPGENGNWLLQQTARIQPRIVRILATAYTDFTDAVAAINDGGIFHYVNKPWDPAHLEGQLRRAMEFFLTQRENEQLAQEKLEALRNLMVADRLVSLGMLTAGLSHHIRNALVTVKTFLDLSPAMMQEEKADAQNIRNKEFWTDYHKSVLGQIDKINNLLKDLWAASEKPATQTTERVNLHALVNETVEHLKSSITAKNITVTNEIPVDLQPITAERDKFNRLFDLLLKEELASLPAGGKINFTAGAVNHSAKPEIRVQIADNGPGLSAEKLQCLFDPFMVRADAPSEYGIHLMGCFFIVHHHGGRIEATSEEGKGTTFTLHLPVSPVNSLDELNQGILQKSRLAEQVWGGVRSKS